MVQATPQQLIWSAIAIVISVFGLVSVVTRRIRQQNRLPLPPGPKPWPVVGNLFEMEAISHQGFANLARKYGPLIHLKLGSVSIMVASNVRLAKEVLKTNDHVFSSRPRVTQFVELAYDNQTISTSPYGPTWRNATRVLKQELITPARMEHFKATRQEEILTAIQTLLAESSEGKAVRLDSKFKIHLMNILTMMMVSKRFFGPKADNGLDSLRFQKATKDVTDLLGVFHLGDYFPLFKLWDVQGHKKMMKVAHENMDRWIQGIFDERRQELGFGDSKVPLRGDFLDVLLTRSNKDDEIMFTDDMMKGIFQDIFLGGVESPASTVEWALAELLKHPEQLKKAQDELDTVVGRQRLVDESDIPSLPYLRAIVKETFRLHPVTPLLIPRESSEACELGGFHIPSGSQIFVNIWAIGRDPEYWDKPTEFNPDRFLGSPIDPLGQHFELVPFGSGRRKCPGIGLGLVFVEYFLAFLIQGCEWSLPDGQAAGDMDMADGIGIVNHKNVPLEACASPRLPQHVIFPADS